MVTVSVKDDGYPGIAGMAASPKVVSSASDALHLVPMPVSVAYDPGCFVLTPDTVLVADDEGIDLQRRDQTPPADVRKKH